MSNIDITATVNLNQDMTLATIKLTGRTMPIVTGVLGTELDDKGDPSVIYLNSRIRARDSDWRGWQPSGAVSTILTRKSE